MEKRRPDLVLLDYDMPGWDGKQTFEKIRENPDYQDVPVVFISLLLHQSSSVNNLLN